MTTEQDAARTRARTSAPGHGAVRCQGVGRCEAACRMAGSGRCLRRSCSSQARQWRRARHASAFSVSLSGEARRLRAWGCGCRSAGWNATAVAQCSLRAQILRGSREIAAPSGLCRRGGGRVVPGAPSKSAHQSPCKKPLTLANQGLFIWCRRDESNTRPSHYEGLAGFASLWRASVCTRCFQRLNYIGATHANRLFGCTAGDGAPC